MGSEYPWYEVVEGDELQQGDFIDDCEVLNSSYTFGAPSDNIESDYVVNAESNRYDLVIVSQSCDLVNGKTESVLLCPRWSPQTYAKINPEFEKVDVLEQIRQGKQYRYCMLGQCDFADASCDIQIVDLGTVFSIPYDALKQIVKLNGSRLRLHSPYKEKLAQTFAYYYMRIALPEDIPKFEKRPKTSSLMKSQ